VLVAVAAVLVAGSAVGGFVAGRMTAPTNADGGAACSSATSTLDRMLKVEAPADETQEAKNLRIGTMSNVILQNPDCFDAETRATAQAFKDQRASDDKDAAVSDAADHIAECMSRIDVGFGC
jgi:hypothetical protein